MASDQGANIRIGALAPLSLPGWVEAGRHLLAGMELAVCDANNAGGIGVRALELVVRDTAADPQRAAAAVEELARLDIVALAGEYHSVVARSVAAKADALGIPFLCSSAVLDQISEVPIAWVARLAAVQSRGWRVYADFLLSAGHSKIAVAAQSSVYWAAGICVLREHLEARGASVVELDASALNPDALCSALLDTSVTAVLLLTGTPEPAVPIVQAVRRDPRLSGLLIGAPAGQPEFSDWIALLGAEGAAIPFLRYLPERLSPLGTKIAAALTERLAALPSFVAFEGYDTILVLAEAIRSQGANRSRIAQAWPHVAVDGTRGTIRFSRTARLPVWQWMEAPIQIVERDPLALDRFRILRAEA